MLANAIVIDMIFLARHILAIFIFFTFIFVSPGQQPRDTRMPHIEWDHEYGEAGLIYFYKTALITQDSIYISSIATADLGLVEGHPFVLKLDPDGKGPKTIELRTNIFSREDQIDNSILVGKYDQEIIAIASTPHKVGLFRLSPDNTILGGKIIFESTSELTITRIIPDLKNSTFLLMGTGAEGAMLMKYDIRGTLLWRQSISLGRNNVLWDAMPTIDGGFIVAANIGNFGPAFQGEISIWLAQYDSSGRKLKESTHRGRFGSLARIRSRYVLIYDKSTDGSQDIVLSTLDQNLAFSKEVSIIRYTPTIPIQFKISEISKDTLLIIGAKDENFSIYIGEYNDQDRYIQSWSMPGTISMPFDILSYNPEQYILTTASYTVTPGKKILGKLKATKISL